MVPRFPGFVIHFAKILTVTVRPELVEGLYLRQFARLDTLAFLKRSLMPGDIQAAINQTSEVLKTSEVSPEIKVILIANKN